MSSDSMLFGDGYRPNVCIVICNEQNQILLFKRVRGYGWQFPQGGVMEAEEPCDTMFRELYEETGLVSRDVKILAQTNRWLRYNVPHQWMRLSSRGVMRGQKQLWFLLQLVSSTQAINFFTTERPEFNDWQWVSYWEPVHRVINFKKSLYQRALIELSPYLPAGVQRLHRLFDTETL